MHIAREIEGETYEIYLFILYDQMNCFKWKIEINKQQNVSRTLCPFHFFKLFIHWFLFIFS